MDISEASLLLISIPDFPFKLTFTSDARAILDGNGSGFFNTDSNVVVLDSKRICNSRQAIISQAFFHAIRTSGLKGVLNKENYSALCRNLYEWKMRELRMEQDGRLSSSKKEKIGEEYLVSLSTSSFIANETWEKISAFISDIYALERSTSLTPTLKAGFNAYRKSCFKNSVNTGDYNSAIEYSVNIGNAFINTGPLSDSYRRAGYSTGFDVTVNRTSLNKIISKSEDENDAIIRACKDFRKPLAILKNIENDASGNKVERRLVVLNNPVNPYRLISVSMPTPDEMSKKVREGKKADIKFRTTSALSLCNLLSYKDNILFLQPKNGEDGLIYEISDYMRTWSTKDAQQLANKPITSMSKSYNVERIMHYALKNIEEHRNVISDSRARQLFNEEIPSPKVKVTADMLNLLFSNANTNVAFQEENIEKKNQTSLSSRLNKEFRTSFFSKAVAAKLRKDNVLRYKDLLSLGEDGIEKNYGLRAVRDAIKCLQFQGFSFEMMHPHPTTSPEMFRGLPEKEKMDTIQRNIVSAVESAGSIKEWPQVKYPYSPSGKPIEGVDMLMMICESVRNESRWKGCNLFISEDEAKKLGVKIKHGAYPIYGVQRRPFKPTIYFNASETNLQFTQKAGTKDVPVSMQTFVSTLKGIKDEIAQSLMSFLDSSYTASKFGLSSIDTEISQRKEVKKDNLKYEKIDIPEQKKDTKNSLR